MSACHEYGWFEHLLQDTDDPRLGLVVDQIVNLEITMDHTSSVVGLGRRVSEEGDHVIEMGNAAHSHLGINVHGLSLRS